jgi:hypothetical protein
MFGQKKKKANPLREKIPLVAKRYSAHLLKCFCFQFHRCPYVTSLQLSLFGRQMMSQSYLVGQEKM